MDGSSNTVPVAEAALLLDESDGTFGAGTSRSSEEPGTSAATAPPAGGAGGRTPTSWWLSEPYVPVEEDSEPDDCFDSPSEQGEAAAAKLHVLTQKHAEQGFI